MTYTLTLSKGLGNTVLAMPFAHWLAQQGHTVYCAANPAKKESGGVIREVLLLFGNCHHGEIKKDGYADQYDLWENAKHLFNDYAEWQAWFVWHGFDPPDSYELPRPTNAHYNRSGIVIAPCTKPNWPLKKYPHWQSIISQLPEKPALVGAPSDGDMIDPEGVVDCRGADLITTGKLLATADTVIAEEGGVAHLAAAMGARTLILTGGTGIRKNVSFSPTAEYIYAPGNWQCRPCQYKGCAREGSTYYGCNQDAMVDGYAQCMHAIKPQQVTNELKGDSKMAQQKTEAKEHKTLIMPAYNATETIGEALQSVCRQTVRPDSVLIGVDGCRNTLNEAQRLQEVYASKPGRKKAETLPIEVYWFSRNVGPFRVRNTLALLSKPGIIVTFDADDVMYDCFMEKMTKTITPTTFCVAISRQYKPTGEKYSGLGNALGIVGIYRETLIQHGCWESWRASADAEAVARWQKGGLTKHHPGYIPRGSKKPVFTPIMDQCKQEGSVSLGPETGYGSDLRKAYTEECKRRREQPVRCDSIGIADFAHIPRGESIDNVQCHTVLWPVSDDPIKASVNAEQDDTHDDGEARRALLDMVGAFEPSFDNRQRNAYKRAKKVLGIR